MGEAAMILALLIVFCAIAAPAGFAAQSSNWKAGLEEHNKKINDFEPWLELLVVKK